MLLILDNYYNNVISFEFANLMIYFQTILTHSRSRVVLEILKMATEQKKRLNVYVTESCPDKSG